MKDVKLYSDIRKDHPRIRALFKYLSDRGYRLILNSLDWLKGKPSGEDNGPKNAVMLRDDMNLDELVLSPDYYNRYVRDKWLDIVKEFEDGTIEVMDMNGSRIFIHSSWVR